MLSLKRTLAISCALTLVVWFFVAWPLPRYFFHGIPASTANVEKGGVRRMFQGDHLQLLYNYWLIADMFAGQTPWFHNIYEFNTGDDSARRYLGIDDAPFVFLFALLNPVAGRAVAWNVAQFVALWLTHLFSWLLLRRYLRSPTSSALLALLSITLPYRWSSLFGGSPSGFAMTWVPLWMWGLDAAVRRGRIIGGILAGLAVVFASWNDAHVFFFSVLAIPCWMAAILLLDADFPWRSAMRWKQAVLALIPFVFLAGSVIVVGQLKHAGLAETTFEAGREWREVALYSPQAFGLWTWRGFGHEAQIYLGFALPVYLTLGLLLHVRLLAADARAHWRFVLAYILLIAGALVAIALALGTRGPMDALALRAARKLIPPYAMIRQPAKIFCLMPSLLALAAALTWRAWAEASQFRRNGVALAALLAVITTAEYGLQIRPTVCLLDTQQGAYAAVAEDAASRGNAPRAIVLPIWPGDSSWASLYEHYVSLYRIRMINGYQPAVPKEYVNNVFAVFESFNCGLLDDSQRAALKNYGIEYVLLHEDAFPEKVSWFPVAFTLKRLLNHPYLQLLRQDQSVWAFRLLDEPRTNSSEVFADWQVFFPNYQHEMEWSADKNTVVVDDSASGKRFASSSPATPPIVLRPFEHLQAPNPLLLLRCRGQGQLTTLLRYDDGEEHRIVRDVALPNWDWVAITMPDFGESLRAGATFAVSAGSLELDLVIYASGRLPEVPAGEQFSLPAPLFFHAGYTDTSRACVVLRKEYEPADVIFYGPKLPLAQGHYRIALEYDSQAPDGVVLGDFFIETEQGRSSVWPVLAGGLATGEFSSLNNNLPFVLRFRFSREADLRLYRVTFTRVR